MANNAVKGKQINVKVNEAEKAGIKAKADAIGLDVSEYMRFTALNADVKVTVKGKNDSRVKELEDQLTKEREEHRKEIIKLKRG